MYLLTEDLFEEIPPLRAQEDVPNERKIVYVKLFFPVGKWTWFVMEGEEKTGGDILFYGYIVGLGERFGYFTLKDLESVQIAGLAIERDLCFEPGTFGEVIRKFRAEREEKVELAD